MEQKQKWAIARTPKTEDIFDALANMRLIQRKVSLLMADLKLAQSEAEYKKAAFFSLIETLINTRGTDISLRITKEEQDLIEISEIDNNDSCPLGMPSGPNGHIAINLKDLLGRIINDGGSDE